MKIKDILAEIHEHEIEEGRPLERIIVTPAQYEALRREAAIKVVAGGPRILPKKLTINSGISRCVIVKGPP